MSISVADDAPSPLAMGKPRWSVVSDSAVKSGQASIAGLLPSSGTVKSLGRCPT
ncbi:MAG: hypothetical protein R3F11_21285 [Verrucomicrobiales bacterium]